jgi:glycosyltransferase domain-containing protein
MNELITLLIPSHNRHLYLDRILDYYKDSGIPVIVTDSSMPAYHPVADRHPKALHYIHCPGIAFTEKLDRALQEVHTPYVVMCADDDFILPDGIAACLDFLQRHKGFTAAQGNFINYRLDGDRIDFRIMYPGVSSWTIDLRGPFERLETLFRNFKTFFNAVYRTEALQLAFRGAGKVISNLYLNEYLTAIIPLALGNYIEIPVFYQVRESSESSGDRTTPNLDRTFYEDAYAVEREAYLLFLTATVAGITGEDSTLVRRNVEGVLSDFAGRLRGSGPGGTSLKKKIGGVVGIIPLIGPFIIRTNRQREIAMALAKVVKTREDRNNLGIVSSFIRKYRHAIG